MEIGTLGWSGPQIAPAYRGGTGFSGAFAPNGSLPIGNGAGFTLATITGTTNEITVTNGAGTITLSTPQAIGTTSTPTFSTLALTAATNQLILDNNGTLTWTPTTSRTIIIPDVDGTIITTGNLTSITTVGTISTGVWHGTIVGNLYGGTGLDTSTAGNGRLLIGNGSGFSLSLLTGTTNQVNVTNGSGSITLSLPQSIDSTATPTFASLSLTAATNQITFDVNGVLTWTPTTSRTIILPDVGGTVITTGNLTSITTVGTIGTGTWHGTAIETTYGGTGLDTHLAGNGTLLIGNGSGFTLASLTAGSGITISPGAGSISIAATGTSVGGTLYNWANFS